MARPEGEQLDPTEGLTLEVVKKRAVSGVLTLTGRMFLMQAVLLVANFFLTVFLLPEEYGTYAIVGALLGFFGYFSNVGLAAALVQKKESPTEEELRTTFTVQQLLVILLIITVFLLTPLLSGWQHLTGEAVYLVWAMSFSLLLSSLKTIPAVLLERRLDFAKLVIPEILETVVFSAVAVVLAWKGFGIGSYTFAVLSRGIVGLVVIYILQPWAWGIAFSRNALRGLFRFGLPYQANTFLALVKDEGLVIVLGSILGPAGVGLLAWAKRWGEASLRFFMDQVIKVTFPAFSRLQHDKKALSRAVSHSIFFVCFLVFPSLVGLATVAPVLVEIIPKYQKWEGALLALVLFSINAAWAAVTTPLTNLLNAIGKITTTFRLMAMWTALSWIFVPLLAIKLGVNGAAAGYALVGVSSVVAVWIVYKNVKFDFLSSVVKPFAAAVVMGMVTLFVRSSMEPSFLAVITIILAGVFVYVAVSFLLVGPLLAGDVKKIWNAVYKR